MRKRKNEYLIEGYNSLHLKTLHDGDIINRLEYKKAVMTIKSNLVLVCDEQGKYRRLKTESLINALNCYYDDKLKCYFKKDICRFYPIVEGVDYYD